MNRRVDSESIPVGFRFHPTDDELLNHYLKSKTLGNEVRAIPEADVYKCEPRHLISDFRNHFLRTFPNCSNIQANDHQWYFFCRQDGKNRTARSTEAGFWKVTSQDRTIESRDTNTKIGTKRTLVFRTGNARDSKGTNWIIHEYHLHPSKGFVLCLLMKKNDNTRSEVEPSSVNGSSPGDSFPPPIPYTNPLPSNAQNLEPQDDWGSYTTDLLPFKLKHPEQGLTGMDFSSLGPGFSPSDNFALPMFNNSRHTNYLASGIENQAPKDPLEEMSLFFSKGFRFHPTDNELLNHYLKLKTLGLDSKVGAIPEVDVYKRDAWDLPDIFRRHFRSTFANCSEKQGNDYQWYFFCRQDGKNRAARSTEAGFWKVTGQDRIIESRDSKIGTKRTLVFHKGRARDSKGTNWIIHEYHLHPPKKGFVLCLLMKKNDKTRSEVQPSSVNGSSPDDNFPPPIPYTNPLPSNAQNLVELSPEELELVLRCFPERTNAQPQMHPEQGLSQDMMESNDDIAHYLVSEDEYALAESRGPRAHSR